MRRFGRGSLADLIARGQNTDHAGGEAGVGEEAVDGEVAAGDLAVEAAQRGPVAGARGVGDGEAEPRREGHAGEAEDRLAIAAERDVRDADGALVDRHAAVIEAHGDGLRGVDRDEVHRGAHGAEALLSARVCAQVVAEHVGERGREVVLLGAGREVDGGVGGVGRRGEPGAPELEEAIEHDRARLHPDGDGAEDVGRATQLLGDGGREIVVEVPHADGAAGLRDAEVDARDVDLRVAEGGADEPDHAWFVEVRDDERGPAEVRFDLVVAPLHEARRAVGAEDALDRVGRPVRRDDAQGDHRRVLLLRAGRGGLLAHGDAALLGGERRGDAVERAREVVLEATRDGRRGDALRAELGGLADTLDLDRLGREVRVDLAEERSEALRELQVGLLLEGDLTGDGRGVDRVLDLAGREVHDDLLGDLERDAILSLFRRCAEVRRDDHALVLEERVLRGDRLFHEDVERDAADLSALQALRGAPPRCRCRRGPR